VRAFTQAMVQAPGVASQIAVSHFRRAVSKSEAINDLLTHYHMALMCQVQQTSLCNSVHDATSRPRGGRTGTYSGPLLGTGRVPKCASSIFQRVSAQPRPTAAIGGKSGFIGS
jgi:hypothetical protein